MPLDAPHRVHGAHAAPATTTVAKDKGAHTSPVVMATKEKEKDGRGHRKQLAPPSLQPVQASSPPPSGSAPAGGRGWFQMLSVLVLIGAGVVLMAHNCSLDLGACTTYAKNLSNWGLQLGSFAVLVCVQSCALLLFKLCQTSGSYTFSPASSVALTEACKLGLAATLHWRHVSNTGSPLLEGVSPRIVAHYFGLAMLYTVNNQLTFYAFEVVDPGGCWTAPMPASSPKPYRRVASCPCTLLPLLPLITRVIMPLLPAMDTISTRYLCSGQIACALSCRALTPLHGPIAQRVAMCAVHAMCMACACHVHAMYTPCAR